MKALLEKILKKVIADYIDKAFTLENLKLIRNKTMELIWQKTKETDTQIDDWAAGIIERSLADDNLERIYSWLIAHIRAITATTCMVQPDFVESIANKLNMDNPACKCGNPAFGIVRQFLEVLLPLLIEWLKK